KFSDFNNSIPMNTHGAVLDRCAVHRHDGARTNDHDSPFTTLRAAAMRRLQASWQSNGIAIRLCPVWSCAGSNFCVGNLVEALAPELSRFHKIARRHPPSERQKFPTRSSVSPSEIFAATR